MTNSQGSTRGAPGACPNIWEPVGWRPCWSHADRASRGRV